MRTATRRRQSMHLFDFALRSRNCGARSNKKEQRFHAETRRRGGRNENRELKRTGESKERCTETVTRMGRQFEDFPLLLKKNAVLATTREPRQSHHLNSRDSRNSRSAVCRYCISNSSPAVACSQPRFPHPLTSPPDVRPCNRRTRAAQYSDPRRCNAALCVFQPFYACCE